MSFSGTSFEEPVRILSDLHLAHPGSTVSAIHELRPLLEGAGTILFNGDTFELRKKALLQRAKDYRAELEQLCAKIGTEPVFLTGNHDPEVSGTHYLDLCTGKVFLTHGDILYEDVSPWSKLIAEMREVLGRIRSEYPPDYRDDLELSLEVAKRISAETRVRPAIRDGRLRKLRTLLAEAWPPHRPAKIIKTWLRSHYLGHALRNRFRPGADFIIYGHTHRAMVHEHDDKHVINTGAFMPLSRAMVVEIKGGEISAHDVGRKSGHFCAARRRGTWRVT
ncbi:MAG: metallophosphoesterase [Verrucomicrobiales bacterium]|nr:metallophosphoesterase [Verrucomicrobiales bacterium]MED5587163.1 metallophosphoesterase [Verrucomicrobiota bacterium]